MQRILTFLFAFLLLLTLAIRRDHRLWGHSLSAPVAETVSAPEVVSLGDTLVVETHDLDASVRGYNGPTPLRLVVTAGRIDSVVVLANQETPGFYRRVEEGILDLYRGIPLQEAAQLHVDAVSGATFTSKAVLANLDHALSQIPGAKAEVQSAEPEPVKIPWLALGVLLMTAVVPLFWHHRIYRLVQLTLNVLVLGLYAGTMLSYSSLIGLISSGFSWSYLPVALMLLVALVYPLFGKRGYYCAWCCPLGSAQELMGHLSRRKLPLSSQVIRYLGWGRKGVFVTLMLLTLSGITSDWMNYELFSAFMWQSASWFLVLFAVLTLVLSIFVPRPYCRFLCPTGTLLNGLSR